jgi:hypothetical protein
VGYWYDITVGEEKHIDEFFLKAQSKPEDISISIAGLSSPSPGILNTIRELLERELELLCRAGKSEAFRKL